MPIRDRRIAFVLTNSAAKASQVGGAVGLDSPASLLTTLHAMRAGGTPSTSCLRPPMNSCSTCCSVEPMTIVIRSIQRRRCGFREPPTSKTFLAFPERPAQDAGFLGTAAGSWLQHQRRKTRPIKSFCRTIGGKGRLDRAANLGAMSATIILPRWILAMP